MKKKIILGIAAAGTAVAMLPLFAAFEAHVINVTATIENALSVSPLEIAFGTVFPEEVRLATATIAMSRSFFEEPDADDIEYHIRQKPKCFDGEEGFGRVTEVPDPQNPGRTIFVCEDEEFEMLPILCPYLSKEDDKSPDNDGNLAAFHGPTSTPAWTPSVASFFDVFGVLAKSEDDIEDSWTIDLHVPCFIGNCAQDEEIPDEYELDPALESELFGCDLWVEVNRVSRFSDIPR
ncbi:hypothetical protein A2757_01745 [Candidatus Giovannonibacteria bacterium RIFCSPHIGHO2_01_FULL_48_47]|nr:MAG: hypothetical protein A2757_01745 [Candidatus Giovannonibacteria bacterium RIFCSPHIGHO2_01_FULL_48_47]OGF68426.1 MAG: hypothetical protein A3D61_00940 [Candidatus Giovannonibacteria bacterium RIFCSPHIGHO2_02_FULL_48_15]OGF88762.1 MAG: hypothetical protein A3B26_03030 [Candidatus Giovannonibacteria bacterium RIFCSPLOWO2_01_FULL_48_47]OGF94947.1 MAG: hypothetical protein A2433_02695 [Candidatus Giovannonibacteria bacterium RIFOXYC1_FULL_48_8]OGF96117.1 MAG: hypothetical protein A2613_00925